jgi:copper homeostasis protein CutC
MDLFQEKTSENTQQIVSWIKSVEEKTNSLRKEISGKLESTFDKAFDKLDKSSKMIDRFSSNKLMRNLTEETPQLDNIGENIPIREDLGNFSQTVNEKSNAAKRLCNIL